MPASLHHDPHEALPYEGPSVPSWSSRDFERVSLEELVALICSGDTLPLRAWEELLKRSHALIWQFSTRLIRGTPIPEEQRSDLVHQFVSKKLSLDWLSRFEPGIQGRSFEAWLYRTFVNFVTDERRGQGKGARRFTGLEEYDETRAGPPGAWLHSAQQPQVIQHFDTAHRAYLVTLIQAQAEHLPIGQREVILAYFRLQKQLGGKVGLKEACAQIAEDLKMPPSTVKTYLYRAKKELRDLCTRYMERNKLDDPY